MNPVSYTEGFEKIDWKDIQKPDSEHEILARFKNMAPLGICTRKSQRFGYTFLEAAPPFFYNPRGILVHRPAMIYRISKINCHGEPIGGGGFSHYAVKYFCGGGTCFDSLEACLESPGDRLVCQTCEHKAEQQGQKSSDELAGAHVHKGRLVAQRTCCNEHRN